MRTFTDGNLIIRPHYPQPRLLQLSWIGRSQACRPEQLLHSFLQEVLDEAKQNAAAIAMSFGTLEYLNSSTVAVLVQFLNRARSERVRLELRYRPSVRWQKMSFEALRVFEQIDQLVQVVAEPNA